MFCKNCGTEITDESTKFCPVCGTPVAESAAATKPQEPQGGVSDTAAAPTQVMNDDQPAPDQSAAAQPTPDQTAAAPTQVMNSAQPSPDATAAQPAPAAPTQVMPQPTASQPPVDPGQYGGQYPNQQYAGQYPNQYAGQYPNQYGQPMPPQPEPKSKKKLIIGIVIAVVVVLIVVVFAFGGSSNDDTGDTTTTEPTTTTDTGSDDGTDDGTGTTSGDTTDTGTTDGGTTDGGTTDGGTTDGGTTDGGSTSTSMQTIGSSLTGSLQVPSSWENRTSDYRSELVDDTGLVFYVDPSTEYTSGTLGHYSFAQSIELRMYPASYQEAAMNVADGWDIAGYYGAIDSENTTFNGHNATVLTTSIPDDGVYICYIEVDRDGDGNATVEIRCQGTPSTIQTVLGYAGTWSY